MNESSESLIRSVLTSEVKFVIGIVVFVLGVARPYYEAKQDIALIQSNISNINANHEVHIQDILKNIEEIKKAELNIKEEQIRQQQMIITLIQNKTE